MKASQFSFRTDDGFMASIDDWRVTRRPIPGRAEAIRILVQAGIEHLADTPKPTLAPLEAEPVTTAAEEPVDEAPPSSAAETPPRVRQAVKVEPTSRWRDAVGPLKRMITASPGWSAYKAEHALKIETMRSQDAVLPVCEALGIAWQDVFAKP